ncbi:shiftless antiviral inhibitor of ribosomal frameshifting protein homolog [Physella acuta]|uniref:shiftless antiviral inhibitor of ribosomal frameshifting protein homolog n=1 Tax=Physella acuta TaxID=109671 RepID=UPI0027DD3EC9|nr:shiftless antiviral inhibitor of ribosomal frameshifting protein homolog [Physella acuta]
MDYEEDENENIEKNARKFRELFRGRFTQGDAVRIVKEFQGLGDAVQFFLTASSEQVSEFLGEDQVYQANLQADADHVMARLASDLQQDASEQQFACQRCDKSWWKKVPNRKMVSTCNRCKQKLKAIPKENQWGWGRFHCEDCDNKFYGVGTMGMTKSKCYDCDNETDIKEIIPPRIKKEMRKTRNNHNCNGINCYNGYNTVNPRPYRNDIELRVQPNNPHRTGREGKPAVCIHKFSPRPASSRVRTWSEVHISSGSTVTTCIDQGSLNTGTGSFAYTMYTSSIRQ